MSEGAAFSAFVRESETKLVQFYEELEYAEKVAQQLARLIPRRTYYTGYIGSDPRTHSRWAWDDGWRDVIKFACND